MPSIDPLDVPLLRLTPTDHVTARDLCSGVLCTGMTGSGKSSGPAATLLRAFARSGMGGVLTCAKPGDAEAYYRLLASEGRASSVIVWDGSNGSFNLMSWSLAQAGEDGAGSTVESVARVIEMKRAASATPGAASDPFWTEGPHQMLRKSIPIIHAATGTVRIKDILRFVRSAPRSPEEMRDPEWQRGSFFYRIFAQAAGQIDDALGAACIAYWSTDFGALDAKTRGNLLISLSTVLDALSSGWLGQAFSGETTLVPELCFSGVIIILDMPALTRHEEGVLAQQIFLYAFQKAVLSRNGLAPAQRERVVFLMIDEFQLFCSSPSQFADFLSTCRSSRCATVLLTQSLASIYARMGPQGHDRTHQLIANCATKIWAANNCTTTNSWAADMIGKSLQWRDNHSRSEGTSSQFGMNMGEGSNWGTSQGSGSSSSYGPGGGGGSSWNSGSSRGGSDQWGKNRGTGSNSGESWGASQQLDYRLPPDAFGRMLKTGGPAYANRVSAVWHQSGRVFDASGDTWLVVEFAQ